MRVSGNYRNRDLCSRNRCSVNRDSQYSHSRSSGKSFRYEVRRSTRNVPPGRTVSFRFSLLKKDTRLTSSTKLKIVFELFQLFVAIRALLQLFEKHQFTITTETVGTP